MENFVTDSHLGVNKQEWRKCCRVASRFDDSTTVWFTIEIGSFSLSQELETVLIAKLSTGTKIKLNETRIYGLLQSISLLINIQYVIEVETREGLPLCDTKFRAFVSRKTNERTNERSSTRWTPATGTAKRWGRFIFNTLRNMKPGAEAARRCSSSAQRFVFKLWPLAEQWKLVTY